MAIGKLENYDKDNPPIIGEDVPIHIYARNRKGDFYDLSGTTKIYCTLKSDLTTEDGSAPLQIDSVAEASQFDLTRAASGEIVVTLPYTLTDNLTPGTLYYMDVKAIWSGAQKYILRYAELRFAKWVTQSTS